MINYINTSYEYYSKFVNNVKFWEVNYLFPLYIELEICKENQKKYFFDSYYVLPSDYEELINKNKITIYDKLINFERFTTKILPQNIKNENKRLFEDLLKTEKEEFKKTIKENQYSQITIIGLYASFITYILANVNVLPFLINFSLDAVYSFMLIFGVVIIFFIASIKLLFSFDKSFIICKQKINYIPVWLISSILIIFYSIYSIGNFNTSKENEKFRESLKKYQIELLKKENENQKLKDSLKNIK